MRSKILTLCGSLFFTFLIIEIALRALIALNLGGLRNPDIYFNSGVDDRYWQYRLIWTDFAESGDGVLDPNLGWAPKSTAENPFGLIRSNLEQGQPIDTISPAILFFGDSFVQAHTAPADAIPQQIGLLLPDTNVYNLGVRGYGVDQIYLRMRQTAAEFEEPTLLFGILSFDLDRSILNVRSAPKPRLSFEDGAMTVHNVPFSQTAEEWIGDHPPRTISFASTLVRRVISLSQANGAGLAFGPEERVAEKEQLNREIMDHAANFAAENDYPLTFVIFFSREEFNSQSWREPFLLEMCAMHNCINTKPALEQAMQEQGRPIGDFYLPDGFHLNEEGNKIVAQYIVGEMEKR